MHPVNLINALRQSNFIVHAVVLKLDVLYSYALQIHTIHATDCDPYTVVHYTCIVYTYNYSICIALIVIVASKVIICVHANMSWI